MEIRTLITIRKKPLDKFSGKDLRKIVNKIEKLPKKRLSDSSKIKKSASKIKGLTHFCGISQKFRKFPILKSSIKIVHRSSQLECDLKRTVNDPK